jgi:GNAT superfamily N-acetyltransferase
MTDYKYKLSTDPSDMQIDIVHGLLASSYWSANIRIDVLREAIANSVVIGAFERAGGRQVSFARVVTDYATFAWVCDVFVDENHRGRGIAHAMIEELHRHPRLQTLRRWCLATKDAHSLYAEHGYEPVKAGNWMERRMPEAAWQAT